MEKRLPCGPILSAIIFMHYHNYFAAVAICVLSVHVQLHFLDVENGECMKCLLGSMQICFSWPGSRCPCVRTVSSSAGVCISTFSLPCCGYVDGYNRRAKKVLQKVALVGWKS